MSNAIGPGKRRSPRQRFEECEELWEYYNPALALVDGREIADGNDDTESASVRELGDERGGHDEWGY